jgi:Ca2+-binding RTX toxin-like protein
VNDAPLGASRTVTILEDTPYTFTATDFGFSDPNDDPADNFFAVKIATLPSPGSLTDDGADVTAGQYISLADLAVGKLQFAPDADANGAAYAAFTFQVQDDGGTANGGVDLDPTPRTLTVNVTPVNDAPLGASTTVTTLEDTPYTFTTSDFGFTDPNDSPANSFTAVEITTLPTAGTLTDNGTAVAAGQYVILADLAAGKLVFTPAANANGTSYGSFTFQVQDDGGTVNGGVDLDPTPKTLTVNVTPVNDAPLGASTTVTALEDTPYTFTTSDFGFTDPNDSPTDNFLAVAITTLPSAGSLTDNGAGVTAGQYISLADLAAGKFVFTPAANANGTDYATFTFQVQDDGGMLNGGVDLDPVAKTMTVNVTPVNDAPLGASTTVTTLEDTPYTFAASDFGFTDPNDNPPDHLLAVMITTLPSAGSLTDNGAGVTAGQYISLADLAAGKFVFTPAANGSGAGYAAFTLQVQDDGGMLNGGVDLDPVAKTMTVNVTPVNDAPLGASTTVTTLEDTPYTFAASDFGFTDPSDSPAANGLMAVLIATLPCAGELTCNDGCVTAGQYISLADLAAGKLVFTPAAHCSGTGYASFTFQVQDDGGTANDGVDLDPVAKTMTVNVTPVNSPPVAVNDAAGTLMGMPVAVAVLANDSDADGDILNINSFTQPGHGSVTNSGNGTLLYTPSTTFVGCDSFNYTVSDGHGGSSQASVALTVMPLQLVISAGMQAGDGSGDTFRLVRKGDGIEVTVNDKVAFTTPFAIAPLLKFTGSNDVDTFIVDFSAGSPIFSRGVSFDGKAARETDSLILTGGSASTETYTFTGTRSGIVSIDGSTLSYTAVGVITDTVHIANRSFLFGSGSDTIIVGDDGVPNNGISRITGAGNTVNFSNPTDVLMVGAGAGNDKVTLQQLDQKRAITFAVTIDGGAGADTIDASRVAFNVTLLGGAGTDSLLGGAGNDYLDGGLDSDLLFGGAGDDTLLGGTGTDSLDGGAGNDYLDGGAGTDYLQGGDGDDTLVRGVGNDLLYGGPGHNSIIQALQAAEGASLPSSDGQNALTQELLQPIVAEALARWSEAGADPNSLLNAGEALIQITDLPGDDLGEASAEGVILIDRDAAGHGWFIDLTPADNSEFQVKQGEFVASSGAAAAHMDLLTVVMHEVGHVLGYSDLDLAAAPTDLMSATLDEGVRRLPDTVGANETKASSFTPAGSGTAADAAVTRSPAAPVTAPLVWDPVSGGLRGLDSSQPLAGVTGFAPTAAPAGVNGNTLTPSSAAEAGGLQIDWTTQYVAASAPVSPANGGSTGDQILPPVEFQLEARMSSAAPLPGEGMR